MAANDWMNESQLSRRLAKLLGLAACAFALASPAMGQGGKNIVVWDSGRNSAKAVGVEDRREWKAVPSDLMSLEKDPAKAASDPGYYGREYLFIGDPVVENKHFIAAFSAKSGRMTIHGKDLRRIGEVSLLGGGPIGGFDLVRNAADEVIVDVVDGKTAGAARFTFGKGAVIEVKPSDRQAGIRWEGGIEVGIVPGFVGDDLLFDGATDGEALGLPTDSFFVGLLSGEQDVLVMTWPRGGQMLWMTRAGEKDGKRPIDGAELETDGKGAYLAVLSAPGIWHREPLSSAFLEKDVELKWSPPYPAKWQTQLWEGNVRTAFAFRENKGTIWRGVPGMYNYPAWFEDGKARFHLSKKVPPKGEAIIYFLEGHDTPGATPVDILKETLGRAEAERILDVAGRRLRTHHGKSGSGVHRACTCGYTEAIQEVFKAGQEASKRSYIDQSVKDMIFFVERHMERIDEYREFAAELGKFFESKKRAQPGLTEYLEELEPLARQIPDEFENQQENMKSLAFAADLAEKTMALTAKVDPGNMEAYMDLSKAWRAMGGAQDYVVAQYHVLARKLFQEAGHLAATKPEAMGVAAEIRERCRKILRNPDGYEIWPNY